MEYSNNQANRQRGSRQHRTHGPANAGPITTNTAPGQALGSTFYPASEEYQTDVVDLTSGLDNSYKKLQAGGAWICLHNATAFSSFWPMDYVLKKGSLSWRDFLSNPNIIRKRLPDPGIALGKPFEDINDNYILYKSGRCTMIALQLAGLMAKTCDVDFEYFDVGGHRLARDKLTGLVVDSTSETGPLTILDGEKVTEFFHKKELQWTYEDGTIETKSLDRHGQMRAKDRVPARTREQVLNQELSEMLKPNIEIICYFRSARWSPFQYDQTGAAERSFHGMIKWIPRYSSLQRSPLELQLLPRNGAQRVTKFIWSNKSVNPPIDYCEILYRFIWSHGGPNAERQWRECWPVFKDMWSSACGIWGNPCVEGPTTFRYTPIAYRDLLNPTQETTEHQEFAKCGGIMHSSQSALGQTPSQFLPAKQAAAEFKTWEAGPAPSPCIECISRLPNGPCEQHKPGVEKRTAWLQSHPNQQD